MARDPKPIDTPASGSKAPKQTRAKARVGKKAVVGYFSPELSRTLNIIAATEDVTIQFLVGEALDMLLEDRGYPAAQER